MITDAIYSSFKEGELKNQIVSLGEGGFQGGTEQGESIIETLEEILVLLKNQRLEKK